MCNKDCLNCKEPVCILDKKKKERKPKSRKQYYHDYYIAHRINRKHYCAFCGKEIHGKAYRLGRNLFCGFNCMMCRLWDENEKRMEIVNI